MSFVENIRLHIKVLVSESQDALPIDFPIKCLFCLQLSIIVAIFTLRLQHLVFAESEGCTWIEVSEQMTIDFPLVPQH